jgi:long-chain acyl-CoA synthetase
MNQPWLKFYDKGVKPNIEYPPDLVLANLLERSAEKFPHHRATVFPGALGHRLYESVLTYRQLDDAANRFGNALIAWRQKGDRVAIHLPNSPQFLIAFFGSFKADDCNHVQSGLHSPGD